MRCRPLSSYMCATSCCVWIMFESVSMSFSGLHSLMETCANGIIVAGVTYLVSFCCSMEKCFSMMFKKCLCCCLV